MLAEVISLRKYKISLHDYDYKHDLENRLLLAEFSATDVRVLEEILYSSLHIPIEDLLSNLDLTREILLPSLQKLSKTGLFSFNAQEITVDKEKRKYFEGELAKFDPDFKPNMEFLQNLLKKVPIHVLPTWYAIPRTSNNIFDSLIEKYFLTPQLFQRHLSDVANTDPLFAKILDIVYNAPNLTVYASTLIEKLHLSKEHFEEAILTLEFHFACALSYVKEEDHWKEIVTPFYEWKEYLGYIQKRKITPLSPQEKVERFRSRDFAFVEDAYRVLATLKKKPCKLENGFFELPLLQQLSAQMGSFEPQAPVFHAYLKRILAKLSKLDLIEEKNGTLKALPDADEWLDLEAEERALFLYRHPLNHGQEKASREAEKSILPVLDLGWICFENFTYGISAPVSSSSTILLERRGKTWKYHLPEYSKEDLQLIKTIIFDFFFEVGVVAIGTYQNKDCFKVTPFGKNLFS